MRALRHLLLQFTGLLLKVGDLALQCVTCRLLFRNRRGGWCGGCGLSLRLLLLVQRFDALSQLFGLCARRIKVMRALLHVVRALRVLLLQFAGLPLQIGDLAPQGVTRRLQFRAGGGGY